MPVGPDETSQVLTRVTRVGATDFREEPLIEVRFVPLIGEQGWREEERVLLAPGKSSRNATVAKSIREAAEPIDDIESCSVDDLLERIGGRAGRPAGRGDARDQRVLSDARPHHASELIERRRLQLRRGRSRLAGRRARRRLCPRGTAASKLDFTPFSRFPTWMWRNEEVHDFIDWLRDQNAGPIRPRRSAGFHGLDLYSLFTSIAAVLAYLDDVDPDAARVARARYGALTPWQKDPAAYGQRGASRPIRELRDAVVSMLRDMLEAAARIRAARTASASSMPRRTRAWWRTPSSTTARCTTARRHPGTSATRHMFDTLQALLAFYGPDVEGDRLGAQLARRQRAARPR